MAQKYTNKSGLPISVAVWLAHDTYDYNNDPYTISVTTLLKPLKQIILGARSVDTAPEVDIEDLVNMRMGTAFHDSVEKAWMQGAKEAMLSLGYPSQVTERIIINPDPTNIPDGSIPVYMEQRYERKLGKWTITGKFDFCVEGLIEDFKSTGVYTYIKGNKQADYIMQGSMYKWIVPNIITQDNMRITYLFTDFNKLSLLQDKTKSYPSKRLMPVLLPLKSLQETERFIANKTSQLEKLWDAPESSIPPCTDEELWMDAPTYKYYKNPDKRDRSTKNFDTFHEANQRLADDGFVGVVVEVKSKAKACRYCPAFSVCKQKDELIAQDLLDLG